MQTLKRSGKLNDYKKQLLHQKELGFRGMGASANFTYVVYTNSYVGIIIPNLELLKY